MTSTTQTSLLARVIVASTPAGPAVSASTAAATVARLRKAVHWSAPYLAELTGLEAAAQRVINTKAAVVDRRAAVEIMDAGIGYTVGEAYSPLTHLGRSMALRTLSANAVGVWDPLSRRRVLFAPNVLRTARRYALDQQDFSRWAALRTGLWATHFEHAPHLVDYLGDLCRDLATSSREFAELVVLLAVLPSVELEKLTTRDLPSLGWIRQHRSGSAWIVGLSLLPSLGMSTLELEELAGRATLFARAVMEAGALPQLLESVIALPTSEELSNPQAWMQRVGVTL